MTPEPARIPNYKRFLLTGAIIGLLVGGSGSACASRAARATTRRCSTPWARQWRSSPRSGPSSGPGSPGSLRSSSIVPGGRSSRRFRTHAPLRRHRAARRGPRRPRRPRRAPRLADEEGGSDLRWTDRHQWHITLAFLADVPDWRLDDLTAAVELTAARHHAPCFASPAPGRSPTPMRPAFSIPAWSSSAVTWEARERHTVGVQRGGGLAGRHPLPPHVTLGRFPPADRGDPLDPGLRRARGAGVAADGGRPRGVTPRAGSGAPPALRGGRDGASPPDPGRPPFRAGRAGVGESGQWHAATGRLTHDLLHGEKGPQDACGVFGVWALARKSPS